MGNSGFFYVFIFCSFCFSFLFIPTNEDCNNEFRVNSIRETSKGYTYKLESTNGECKMEVDTKDLIYQINDTLNLTK